MMKILLICCCAMMIGCTSNSHNNTNEENKDKAILPIEPTRYEESPKCINFYYYSRKADFAKLDQSLLSPEELAMLGIYISQYVFVNKAVEEGRMPAVGIENAKKQGFVNLANVCDVMVHMKQQSLSRNLTGKDLRNRFELMNKTIEDLLE